MANNIDIDNVWNDNVVRITTTDQVLGGETGVVNVQAKQLADREEYLKNKIDALTNIVQLKATSVFSILQDANHLTEYNWPGFGNGGIISMTAKAENSRFRISFIGYGDTDHSEVPIWINLRRTVDNRASWQKVLQGNSYSPRQQALAQVQFPPGIRNCGLGSFDVLDNPNIAIGETVEYQTRVRCFANHTMRFQKDNNFNADVSFSTLVSTFTVQEIPT